MVGKGGVEGASGESGLRDLGKNGPVLGRVASDSHSQASPPGMVTRASAPAEGAGGEAANATERCGAIVRCLTVSWLTLIDQLIN